MSTQQILTSLQSPERLAAGLLTLPEQTVQKEWIDYNGHMNVAYYVLAFDHATDRFFEILDLSVDYVARCNCSCFVLETHVTYDREVVEGDPLAFNLQLLDFDHKRMHYYLRMTHRDEGYLAAASELMIMHIDLEARRAAPMPEETLQRLQWIAASQKQLERPEGAGRVMGIRRKP